MKIIINQDSNIPDGEYHLTGRSKLENAKGNLPYGASDRQILVEYDRIAGRVLRDNKVLPPQSIWKIEENYMNKPIEDFSDKELLSVIRRAENVDIPGSLYQRAKTEYDIRHQEKMLKVASNTRRGVYLKVGGDMKNNGTIVAGHDAKIDIGVAGNYSSNNKTKIVQGSQYLNKKNGYKKLLIKVLAPIFIGVVVGGIIYFLGWN